MAEGFPPPIEMAKMLLEETHTEANTPTGKQWAGLGVEDGYFVLLCQTDTPQKYDWLGLYASDYADLNDYVTYIYVTDSKLELINSSVSRRVWRSRKAFNSLGFVARYMRWDYGDQKYRSVAQTPRFWARASS